MRTLPRGTVTLLFTDIEGSTRLLHDLGDEYADVLAEHRRVLREAFARHGGVEVDTQGDAFFVAFASAHEALAAAADAQAALSGGLVRVRVGIHTGAPQLTDEGYVGVDVHRAARVMAAGHGGQVLVSETTRELLEDTFAGRDLGYHRLKDLTEPVRLYQLGDDEFPPLKTLQASNLPIAAGPLFGRERELAELMPLLQNGTRLLTITGPGGTGKTRLALQVAAELTGSFADGVFWVPLAGLDDPALVLPSIEQTIGAAGDLTEQLREKHVLLLLDNAEHLLDAAPALAGLLAATSKLRLLVTSRAPLRVSAEAAYPLDPLATPDAVTLFVERARAAGCVAEPDAVVEAICRRLDGLPLAVELAAARVRLLDPSSLLERLSHALPLLTDGRRDAPRRHRTLRATIEWSYELLDDDAKRLFAALSIFAGSFSLEAAEEVCGGQLETLASLVDFGLIKSTGSSRLLLLETIREYALERLGASVDAESLWHAHGVYFRDLAQRLRPHQHKRSVLDQLDSDRDNFRSALDRAVASRTHDVALPLLSSLWAFWLTKGYGAEAYEWARQVVTTFAHVDPPTRLDAWHGAGEIARFVGDVEWAEELKAEEVATARATGNNDALAFTLSDLSQMAADRGDLRRARELADEAVAIREGIGEAEGIAHAGFALGYAEFRAGNFAQARVTFEKSAAIFEQAHRPAVAERVMAAACRRREGDIAGAASAFGIALQTAVHLGEVLAYPELLQEVAGLAQVLGDLERGAMLIGAADRLYEEVRLPRDHDDREQTVSALRRGLGDVQFEVARTAGAGLGTDEALTLAENVLRPRTAS